MTAGLAIPLAQAFERRERPEEVYLKFFDSMRREENLPMNPAPNFAGNEDETA